MIKIDRNDRTAYWLAVDLANSSGYDKLSFEDRIKWVEENLETMARVNEEADSPWEARNAYDALKAHFRGEKVNHRVYLDASNQALQLYAVLTADKQTAKTCNLANGEVMADAYQVLANEMNKHLNGRIVLTRSNCKKALMTTMYGKVNGADEIIQDLMTEGEDLYARFAEQYGFELIDGKPEEFFMIFRQSLSGIAPKAILAMEAMTEMNATMGLAVYNWTMPDGFKVRYEVYEDVLQPALEVDLGFNNLYKLPPVRERVYGASKVSRGMSPNIIHSVDGYVAREMVRRMNGKFITTIHDAFACHPSDCDLMIQNYTDILCELLESDLLNNILQEISGYVKVEKSGTLTCADIKNSIYKLG